MRLGTEALSRLSRFLFISIAIGSLMACVLGISYSRIRPAGADNEPHPHKYGKGDRLACPKGVLAVCSVGLAAVLSLCFQPSSAEAAGHKWHNSLAPEGEATEELTLTQPAVHSELDKVRRSPGEYPWIVSNYDIVIPDSATTQEQKAAYELAHWLEEITGAMFPVISDVKPRERKEISVGRTRRLESSGLAIKKMDLGDEGYAIGAENGNLYLIGGRKRGPLYAVFALLEEDLGCRWYPGMIHRIPKHPELKFRPVPRSLVPKLEGREPFYWSALSPVWSLRNRTNSTHVPIPEEWGGHMFWALRTHSYMRLVPPDKYFEDHPEYYGLRSGKRALRRLCLTNPDVLAIATESVLEILRRHPGTRAIMVAQEDGSGPCECDKCTALDLAEGSPAASNLDFTNKIAEVVEEEFPGVLVCTYAYHFTNKAPKTIRPRHNVGIRLCNTELHPMPFISVADHEGYQQIQAGWQSVCDNIFIYDYWANYHHYLAPNPNMVMIAQNIRYFVEHGVLEVSGLGTASWCNVGDRDPMRAWVIAKLLWNPDWDVTELMRDFALGYYGKAGPAMAAYDELLRQSAQEHIHEEVMIRPKGGRRFPMDLPFLSREFLDKATELFDEAESLVENEQVRLSVERARLSIMYVKLERGPAFVGDDYGRVLERFESITRHLGTMRVDEHGCPMLSGKLNKWQDDWRSYTQAQTH